MYNEKGVSTMQLLVLILKKVESVDEIMKKLAKVGVKGGTVVDGTGMAQSIADVEDLPMFGILRHLVDENISNSKSKILMFVLRDEEMIKAKVAIKEVVDCRDPNSGIIFSIPITYVEGLCE